MATREKKSEDSKSEKSERRPPEEKKMREPGITEIPMPKMPALKSKPTPEKKPASKVRSKSKSVDVEPVKALPKVTLDVYLLAKGVKPDQTAGFRRWMKNRKVRRQTVLEWDTSWAEFQARPITNRR